MGFIAAANEYEYNVVELCFILRGLSNLGEGKIVPILNDDLGSVLND